MSHPGWRFVEVNYASFERLAFSINTWWLFSFQEISESWHQLFVRSWAPWQRTAPTQWRHLYALAETHTGILLSLMNSINLSFKYFLSSDSQDRELEYITAAVDSVLAKMGGIDWSAYEYRCCWEFFSAFKGTPPFSASDSSRAFLIIRSWFLWTFEFLY